MCAKNTDTKQIILDAAIVMFSERGYDGVTTRDIARAADLKPSSLYSHFSSKEEILSDIYAIYEEKLRGVLPDLDALLIAAESDPPIQVLMKAGYYFDPGDQEKMDRIMSVASAESQTNAISGAFIEKNVFGVIRLYLGKLLDRMVELDRIKPLDTGAFVTLMENYSYSAAIRNFGGSPISKDEWTGGMALLFSLVAPNSP
ncbi:MAG: TetR/AcrR family transcriptional regulator [Clostridiales Family XIII bacterium]|jgi:AcrR family transcriptional regulator|nr:TetR/AcrR family transcriptional regulator [Clostridiales Family XIII bacterium]